MGRLGDMLMGVSPEAKTMAPVTAGVDKMSREQQLLMKKLISYVSPTIGQPGTAYGSPMVAGMAPLEQQIMQYMSGQSGGAAGTLTGAMTPYQAPEEMMKFAAGDYTRPEAFMEGTGKRMVDVWKDEIMPTIGGEFGTRGLFYGSGRREAELESGQKLADTLTSGQIDWETQGRQQQLGALESIMGGELTGRNQEIANKEGVLQSLTTAMGMGGAEREIEQGKLSAKYQEFLRTQPGATPEMAMIMQILNLDPYQYFQGDTVALPGQTGAIQSGGDAFMQGLGSSMSDRRLKKNLIKLGIIRKIPIYLFQYIWSNVWYIGTVAQEILHSYPNAVFKVNGYYAVDYKQLMEV